MKDALKFFQAYIEEMIETGGENLPKTISARLGAKLARIYKKKGINKAEDGLKQSYKVIKARPKFDIINKNTIEVTIGHRKRFCPIGGNFKPEKAEIIQESICKPYTLGFLNELNPDFKFKAFVKKCIVRDKGKVCRYTLQKEKTNT
ncbi:MAG: hypothetical protein P8Y70_05720 [Candidatus Lokiarchaeota archaeon]